MRIRYKILSYSIIAMLLFSGGYLIAVYSNGGTPTIDTTGLSDFPWFNASVGVNAPEFYLNDAHISADLFNFPEQTVSYIIFKSGANTYAKNGRTGILDYSGANSATVIQSALDTQIMGCYLILSGVYTIDYPLSFGGNNQSIEGVGWSTILRASDGLNKPLITNDVAYGGNYEDNLAVRNLKIEGNGGTQSSLSAKGVETRNGDNIIVEFVWTQNTYGAGIWIGNGAINVFICNNLVDTTVKGDGIDVTSFPIGVTIHNNLIVNSYDFAIAVGVGGSDISICGNVIKDVGNATHGGGGIDIVGDVDVVSITGNTIKNIRTDGIYVHKDDANSTKNPSHLTISGNIIKTTLYSGQGSGIHLKGGGSSDKVENVTIIGNTLEDLERYGVYIEYADNVNIIGNKMEGEGGAFAKSASTNWYLRDNIGYITENWGRSEASNDGWITHGLAGTPDQVLLSIEETDANYFLQLKTKNSTQFQIYLYDHTAGVAETTSKTIHWYAIYEP